MQPAAPALRCVGCAGLHQETRTPQGKFSQHLKPTEDALPESKHAQGQVLLPDTSWGSDLIWLSNTPPQAPTRELLSWDFENQPAASRRGLLGRDLSSCISSAESFPLSFLPSSLPFPHRGLSQAEEEPTSSSLRAGKSKPISGAAPQSWSKLEASWLCQQRLTDRGMACARRLLTVRGSKQLQPVRPRVPWGAPPTPLGTPIPAWNPAWPPQGCHQERCPRSI